jgi:hypothetical protein
MTAARVEGGVGDGDSGRALRGADTKARELSLVARVLHRRKNSVVVAWLFQEIFLTLRRIRMPPLVLAASTSGRLRKSIRGG